MPVSATDGYTASGKFPSLCGQGNILPPSLPDLSVFSSSLSAFSCSLLPAIIWLCVLGVRDSTRNLRSCDQGYPLLLFSPSKAGGEGERIAGLAWSWLTKSSPECKILTEANTDDTRHFPVSTISSPTSLASSLQLECCKAPSHLSWGFTLRLQPRNDTWINQLLTTVYTQRYF